jgi:hypothetical protein
MYPIALLSIDSDDILPIDVEHNIERTELWAILICGLYSIDPIDPHSKQGLFLPECHYEISWRFSPSPFPFIFILKSEVISRG